MNLSLTPQQYRMLLTYLKVADWVINSDDRGEDALDEKDMLQHIFKQAATFESEHVVREDKDLALLDVSEEMEEYILEGIIDPYNNSNFWENLIMRLSVRDMADYPELQAESADGEHSEAFFRQIASMEAEYQKEFEAHGLNRLVIDETTGDAAHGHEHVHGEHCNHDHH